MSSGSEFQTTGPETRKLLGPKPRVLVRGTVRSPRTAERRWALASTSRTGLQVRLRYVGPRPWTALRTKTAILNSIRWWMGSQWSSSLNTGVMWSSFHLFDINLAAALRTDWIASQQCLWHRKKCCCNSRHDLIWESGPVFLQHPWKVIFGWISAVSAGRNSFEWCCLHAGPFPVPCRMSRRDTWRRSKIRYGVHRLSWSLCRSSPAAVWIQATRIESCRSSASADLTSSIPRLFQCTRPV